MLPAALDDMPAEDIRREFGAEFADALKDIPMGGWHGPVRSGFGLHLVEMRARSEGRPATLDEARAAVERDLLHARTEEGKAAYYAKLRAEYKVRIESGGPAAAGASRK